MKTLDNLLTEIRELNKRNQEKDLEISIEEETMMEGLDILSRYRVWMLSTAKYRNEQWFIEIQDRINELSVKE
jgi:hypothetical protein